MDKIGIYIDGGYLAKILLKEYPDKKIDFKKLQNTISEKYDLFRTYYYTCPPYRSSSPSQKERDLQANFDKFIYNLHQIPHFQIRQGILVCRNGMYEQKRIDVMLAANMVRCAWNKTIQRAALIAGDGDFVPIITDIKDAGVIVLLYFSYNAIATELFDVCDERIEINDNFINKILLNR